MTVFLLPALDHTDAFLDPIRPALQLLGGRSDIPFSMWRRRTWDEDNQLPSSNIVEVACTLLLLARATVRPDCKR